MDNITLYTKLNSLPLNLKKEVLDFIDFILSKNKNKNKNKIPMFGSGKGMFVVKPDFDDPIEDFKEYM